MSQFVTLNTLIGNGKSYKVPIYQRDYSWDKDDWEDLWNDIIEIPKDGSHYLGYIVLQQISKPDEYYWVIDGQQRLTTLSLLALAVTALLKKWSDNGIEADNNKARYEEEVKRYLGNFSTSKLTISPKLTLNRNNDDYYRSWLLALRQPPAISKLKPSVRLLQKAFDYFYSELEHKFKKNEDGAELTQFLEKVVGNCLVFTVIYVDNDLDAFKVFETLNARGVKLSTADLLKNYLFSQSAKKGQIDLDEAERRWSNIVDLLGKNDITTYIRHFWNSQHKLERQQSLFKAIKNKVDNGDESFELLNELEQQAVFYAAFNNPSDELWDKEERKHFQVLKLLEVSTCFSLLLAALKKINRGEFKSILKEVVAITLRYSIGRLNPNEAERVFSSVANDISNGKIVDVKSMALALKSIYVLDDNFEQSFATAIISTKRKKDFVKYLLVKIENQISSQDYQFEEAVSTIEHILPENPGSIWDESFSREEQLDFMYWLGNYSLLEASINNKLDNNMPFVKKKQAYGKSKYKLSNEYCEYDTFNASVLKQRQEKLARIAKTIWKSSYIK